MTKIKICGITNVRDARFCAAAGADFLGFVFYKKSPRYVSPLRAQKIIKKIKRPVLKVGVFVNERQEIVKRIALLCRLDILQFHGDETGAYLKEFKSYRVIKALRLKSRFSLKEAKSFPKAWLLLDAFKKDAFGGTGRVFDWRMLGPVKKYRRPVIVSGGLTAQNVGMLFRKIRPFAVDVSSGVERAPGKKDYQLVKEFVREVRRAGKYTKSPLV